MDIGVGVELERQSHFCSKKLRVQITAFYVRPFLSAAYASVRAAAERDESWVAKKDAG